MKYSDLDHAFTKIIKMMSILKSIWPDSLVVSSQFDTYSLVVSSQFDTYHTYLDRILGRKTFYDCQMYAFKSKLFTYFMPSYDYLYIFSF